MCISHFFPLFTTLDLDLSQNQLFTFEPSFVFHSPVLCLLSTCLSPNLAMFIPCLVLRTYCFPSSQEPSCLFLSALHLVPSALAVGERETALGSPCLGTPRSPHTHTPLFPRCTFSPHFPFLLCDPRSPDLSAHPRASVPLSRLLCGPLPITLKFRLCLRNFENPSTKDGSCAPLVLARKSQRRSPIDAQNSSASEEPKAEPQEPRPGSPNPRSGPR